jgi:hypothetical protein
MSALNENSSLKIINLGGSSKFTPLKSLRSRSSASSILKKKKELISKLGLREWI